MDCAAADAAGQFVATLRDTGFAILANHGIDDVLLQQINTGWLQFFRSVDKSAYRFDAAGQTGQSGFWPMQISETAVGAAEKDLKEFFHVIPGGDLPAELAAAVLEYRARAFALGQRLLTWIEENVPPGVLAQTCDNLGERLSDDDSILRVVHYPAISGRQAPSAMRAAKHEDINLLTILPVAQEPGLQVLDQQQAWHAVHGLSGQLIINAGDMLQEASGGYFPSTTHSVVNPEVASAGHSRIAVPFFLTPYLDVVLSPRYTAGSYLNERLNAIGLVQRRL